MELTQQQMKDAREAAGKYMMHMTVTDIHGSRYWTPRKIDKLFKYALNAIGMTVADARETRDNHKDQNGYYNDKYDLGHQIGSDLAWHIGWCGRKVRKLPYPNYCS